MRGISDVMTAGAVFLLAGGCIWPWSFERPRVSVEEGVVLDAETGEPIPDAIVTVDFSRAPFSPQEGPESASRFLTNVEGKYKHIWIPNPFSFRTDRYIWITKEGYETISWTLASPWRGPPWRLKPLKKEVPPDNAASQSGGSQGADTLRARDAYGE